MKCKYITNCSEAKDGKLDYVCLDSINFCKVRKNIEKFRVRISSWSIEQEVKDQIELNGFIPKRLDYFTSGEGI